MLSLVLFSLLLGDEAQTVPAPEPSPKPRQEAGRTGPQISVEAELVELDVVVTDAKDRPVTDLSQDDFEVFDEGRRAPISHFARGFAAVGAGSAEAAESAKSAEPSAAESRPKTRYLVLAVDDYHLEPQGLPSVKAALQRFIDGQMAAGDQAAVVAASGSLGALQQFTTDRDVLKRAVERLRAQNRSFRAPLDVPRLTDYQAELIEAGDQEALALAVDEILATEPLNRRTESHRMRLEQQVRSLARPIVSQTAHLTDLTLSSLERLVRGLVPIHGRKVVALFSDGFFLGFDRRSGRRDLQLIADAAVRSGVVIYTIDARGLVASPAIGDASVGGGYDITSNTGVRERVETRAQEAARDGLNALAVDTGGLPFFNRNDLGDSLTRVVEDSSRYYRIGFEPRVSPGDGRFHKVEVRVRSRSGLRVRTARGYVAGGPKAASTSTPETPPTEEEASRQLRTALDSSQPLRALPVDVAADFLETSTGDVVVVTACVDATRLRFEAAADSRAAASFDLVGVLVDEAGKAVGQFSDRVDLNLTPEAHERALRNGLTYRKALTAAPGLLQARVAVREDRSGLLGSASQWVEVPDRARQPLALSSILLVSEGEESPSALPQTARGAVSFDQPRRAETSRRFQRSGHLDYVAIVYETLPSAAAPGDLVVERQILSGSSLLTRSEPSPVSRMDRMDLPAVTGRLRLDAFPPGDYELRLIVTDRASSRTATRGLRFTVE